MLSTLFPNKTVFGFSKSYQPIHIDDVPAHFADFFTQDSKELLRQFTWERTPGTRNEFKKQLQSTVLLLNEFVTAKEKQISTSKLTVVFNGQTIQIEQIESGDKPILKLTTGDKTEIIPGMTLDQWGNRLIDKLTESGNSPYINDIGLQQTTYDLAKLANRNATVKHRNILPDTTSCMVGQSITKGNFKDLPPEDTDNLFEWNCTSEVYMLYQLFPMEKNEWREFIFEIANHSVTKQNSPVTITKELDKGPTNISITDEAGFNKGIFVKIGNKSFFIPGISLNELQKQMRETVADHESWYFQEQNIELIGAVVAIDDLVDGLTSQENVQTFSSKRADAFTKNCKHLYQSMDPNQKNGKTNGSRRNLFEDEELTITEKETNSTLAMAGHQITIDTETWNTLKVTLTTLCENSDQSEYPDSKTILSQQIFEKLSWYGKLNNKQLPPSKQLKLDGKNEPYRSVTDLTPLNLNMQADFSSTNSNEIAKKIVCRHLVTQYILDIWKKGKANWEKHYSSTESIAKHVPIEIEAIYKSLKENAKNTDLISNDDLGQHLIACFKNMQENKDTLKTLLIESTQHSMAIRLHIKGTKDNPIYVVNFYDPNTTNGTVRCETYQLPTLESQTLQNYINGLTTTEHTHDRYQNYYQGAAPISMIIECDPTNMTNSGISSEKKLGVFAKDPLTPTHIHFLLSENLSYDLFNLHDQLQIIGEKSSEELFTLLAAKDQDGKSGLGMALFSGHVQVISVFGQLIQLLPLNKQIELLAATSHTNVPGLVLALQTGQAEGITAYGKILLQLLQQTLEKTDRIQLINLFLAKSINDIPGLFIALQQGQADAIRAYGKLLQELLPLLSKEERADLIVTLAAKNTNRANGLGTSGLFIAALKNDPDAIQAYGEVLYQLLPLFNPAERTKLITSLVTQHPESAQEGLQHAILNGQLEVILANGSMLQQLLSLQCLSESDRNKLIESLGAKYRNGLTALSVAMKNGNVKAIKAYGELLKIIIPSLSPKEFSKLLNLLEARGANNIPGLFIAVENDDLESITAYKELIDLLPLAERTILINSLMSKIVANNEKLYSLLKSWL